MRVLYTAQERARDAGGRPTFPELFEHDERGQLVVDAHGDFMRRDVKRRELRLPTFHALRHGAATECDDAEQARDLLRHKNSIVTRAVYRAHFDDRRREQLRARMEARMETRAETSGRGKAQERPAEGGVDVTDLRDARDEAGR
jgi:integrase